MNKTIVLIAVIIVSVYTSQAQKKQNYMLGFEGWAYYKQTENLNHDGSGNSNSMRYLFSTVYGGKFIAPKTILFLFFSAYYNVNTYNVVHTNPGRVSKSEYYSFSLEPGIGARQYFKLAENDIAGLFLDFRLSRGVFKSRQKDVFTFDTVITTNDGAGSSRSARFNLMPGVYLNLNSKWQVMFKIGTLFYTSSWTNDVTKPNSTVTYPKKSSSFGLQFNAQTISLSIGRFL